jgi:DNA-binding Lrp family transcriptional regulator
MEKYMSQLTKVAKHLRRHNTGAGITAAKLARLAGVSKEAVYKRIYDLRVNEGKTIYSNYRNVKGERKVHYRIAA